MRAGTATATYYLPPALCGVGDLVRCDSQIREDLCDSSGVHAAVRSYIGLTPSVHIHLTHCVATKKNNVMVRVTHGGGVTGTIKSKQVFVNML